MTGTEMVDKVRYELRLSDLQGRGLYATEDIRQGEVVLNLPQVVQAQPDDHSIEAWPGIHVDCSQGYCSALRHSCVPNAVVRNGKIVAWSCIKKNEQICIDYTRTETRLVCQFDCRCGHTKCRRRIE